MRAPDAWSELQRDQEGHILANRVTFPSGMKALGDYAHSKGAWRTSAALHPAASRAWELSRRPCGAGLKYGLYSDAGSATCAGYPGSRGHEDTDAQDFTSWGIDYLK